MRIALNLLFLIPGEVGGSETYATSLIKALNKIDRTNEYYIFLNQEGLKLKIVNSCNNNSL